MRFWDASAVVPLLHEEGATAACRSMLDEDPDVVVWWGTEVECASAIGRGERSETVGPAQVEEALRRLDDLRQRWLEVQPVGSVRTVARRLLRVHPLRSADALQLAAAIVCADGKCAMLAFVCLDARLGDAARREGFPVVVPV